MEPEGEASPSLSAKEAKAAAKAAAKAEKEAKEARKRATDLTDTKTPNAPHPETFRHGQFTRIDDITSFTQAIVETLEIKPRIRRHFEGNDDRRLKSVRQKRFESHGAHSRNQCLTILPVASAPTRHSTFGIELGQRLIERQDTVRWRRKPPLPVQL